MRLYHGTLIHRSRDGYGSIEIVQDAWVRTLHFGNAVRQSAMSLQDPTQLVLTYTRAMMAGLLMNADPRRALLIGLGGGSLIRFLSHYFPACTLEVVELREQVAKLAQGYFLLPDNERLHIHIADGADFVRHNNTAPYDLILVDAYDHAGIAPAVTTTEFYRDCRACLSKTGILAVNLWGHDRPTYREQRAALQGAFGKDLLQLPAEGTTNLITLTQTQPLDRRRLRHLLQTAHALEAETGLEFVRLARRLHHHNSPGLARCLPLSKSSSR